MYEQHPDFESPDEEDKIWRYMDFAKFVSLLEMNALFFARCDKVEDTYEGIYPRKESKEAFENRNASIEHSQQEQKEMFINCWHINGYESAAMWKLYSSENYGIAIQSTFSRLKKSVSHQNNHTIKIGKVKYIDYEYDHFQDERRETARVASGDILGHINGVRSEDAWIRPYIPFLHKRKSFEHERELRAILNSSDDRTEGIKVSVDLNELIERVYVAPTAESWIFELVKAISIRNPKTKNKDIIKSELYDPK